MLDRLLMDDGPSGFVKTEDGAVTEDLRRPNGGELIGGMTPEQLRAFGWTGGWVRTWDEPGEPYQRGVGCLVLGFEGKGAAKELGVAMRSVTGRTFARAFEVPGIPDAAGGVQSLSSGLFLGSIMWPQNGYLFVVAAEAPTMDEAAELAMDTAEAQVRVAGGAAP